MERGELGHCEAAFADGQAYDVAATTDPAGGCGAPLSQPEWLDWARTGLMNVFRITGDCGAFDLLHDLSRDSFLAAIRGRLRGQPVYVDAHDVLQEVFLNIYRYPHRFLPERADAFRNWGHRIVRNTLRSSAGIVRTRRLVRPRRSIEPCLCQGKPLCPLLLGPARSGSF